MRIELECAKKWLSTKSGLALEEIFIKHIVEIELLGGDERTIYLFRKEVIEPFIKQRQNYVPKNINYELAFEAYDRENETSIVKIGKSSFKNNEEFIDCLSDSLSRFLENITDYGIYTEPAVGDFPLSEYEEGIEFYYTNKGMNLIKRWMERMEKLFDKYFPNDVWQEPKSTYYKTF